MPNTEPSQPQRVGIGALLRRLQESFPDLTASKVRFLEDQGLVRPHRTASGLSLIHISEPTRPY